MPRQAKEADREGREAGGIPISELRPTTQLLDVALGRLLPMHCRRLTLCEAA